MNLALSLAGEAVWSGVHGHTTLELSGFFGAVSRDPVRSYNEILTRMSIGLGDDALATAHSLSTARRTVRGDRAGGRVCTMSVAVIHGRSDTSAAADRSPLADQAEGLLLPIGAVASVPLLSLARPVFDRLRSCNCSRQKD